MNSDLARSGSGCSLREVVLCAEEVGVGAGGVGLAVKPQQCSGGGEAGCDGVAVGEGDGASCDAEAEGGQGSPPGRSG